MATDFPAAETEAPAKRMQPGVAVAVVLAAVLAVVAVVQPLAALALAAGVLFLAGYVFRRDLLLAAILPALLFQNLVWLHVGAVNEQLASAVKHADDVLTAFFVLALLLETFFPVMRLHEVPLWKPFGVLVAVCLISAFLNHLDAKHTAIGTYVLLKNFVWFFLAATIPLDARGYRKLVRYLTVVLGAVMAFGFVQLLTGELTYSLLGLPKDYRFGFLRLRAIFLHPVYLAESMALLAVLAVSVYIYLRNPLMLVVAAGAAIAVVLTMLVKTLLALGLTLGLLLILRRPWLVVPYVIAAVAAMVTFAEHGMENVRRQFWIYVESPQSVRREGYRIGGEILRDAPLFGVGPGGFGGFAATVLDSEVPYRYGFINYDGQIYTTVEAHWPHLVGEIGLLGLIAYGVFLWFAGHTAWRVSADPRAPPYQRALCLTAAVFLVVMLIEAVAAQNMEDTLCGLWIFALLGFAQRPPIGDDAGAAQA